MGSPQRQMNFKAHEQANPLKAQPEFAFSAPVLGSYVPDSMMGYKDESMDLNELCIQHPTATYYVRASDDSMSDAGIRANDLVVVDRSIRPTDGNIVVAAMNGAFTIKVLNTTPELYLEPRNHAYSRIEISDSDEFEIFGVVTFVVHQTY